MREIKWSYKHDCGLNYHYKSGEPLFDKFVKETLDNLVKAECNHNQGSGVVLILSKDSPEYEAVQRMLAEKGE